MLTWLDIPSMLPRGPTRQRIVGKTGKEREGRPDAAVWRMSLAGVGLGGLAWPPLRVLSIHFVEQWRCVSGDGHGRALDHGTGRWPRRHPLHFFTSLCFLLLQPLLSHFAPVHRRGVAAAGSAGRRGGGALGKVGKNSRDRWRSSAI